MSDEEEWQPRKRKSAERESGRHKAVKLTYGVTNPEVGTPPELYAAIMEHFNLTRDPCPLEQPEWDGLNVAWGERGDGVYVNPPFNAIRGWLKKTIKEMQRGLKVVVLVPWRIASIYWGTLVLPHVCEVYHFQRYITFEGYERPLNSQICLLVYDASRTSIKESELAAPTSFNLWKYPLFGFRSVEVSRTDARE